MPFCVCGSSKPDLFWLHPGWEVPCGICNCPGMISSLCITTPNVVRDDVTAVASVWGFATARTINIAISYFVYLSQKHSIMPTLPGWVSSLNIIRFYQKLTKRWCSGVETVPITGPGSSSLLSLLSSVSCSSSSWSSASSLLSELARKLRQSPMAFNISSNAFAGYLVVDQAISAFLISSCYCIITVSVSSTDFRAAEVHLSRQSLIDFSCTSLLTMYISCLFSAKSYFWIVSCAMLPTLRSSLNASCSCFNLLDDVVM